MLFIFLKKIDPDIIIQRCADSITGLCAFYCKLYNKKLIFSIANKPDVDGEAEKGIKGKIYRFGINNANLIIAQNKEQVSLLESYKKKKFYNIRVIRSGYNIKNVDFCEKKEFIFWVGRAVSWKRPELFLKLALKFPNEKFVMILNKIRENKTDFWEEISQRALKIPNLKFIEFVPYYKINDYFKAAKLYINTSKFEGYPNTFLQSFINKTPVISLNVNPDQILTLNKIGIYCNNQFYELEQNVQKMLKNPKIYEDYCNNAFNFAKTNHDIKLVSVDWISLIKKLNNKF